jgi:hypothetical protein
VDATSSVTRLSFVYMRDVAKPTRYRIYVRGVLGQTVLTAFPDLQAEIRPGETVLVGALLDQAALYGVLGQIEALGLELLEVRRETT